MYGGAENSPFALQQGHSKSRRRNRHMNIRSSYAVSAPDRARELRAELARKIALLMGSAEKRVTAVPGLRLVRRAAPTAP